MPPLVLYKAIFGGECLTTNVADVMPVISLSPSSMLEAVIVQTGTHREGCPTQFTGEWPLSRMLSLMHHESVHLREGFSALPTCVGALSFLPRPTSSPLLCTEIVTKGIGCLPLIAVIPPLANMLAFVALEVAAVHERRITLITFERALTSVLAVVHVQLTLLRIRSAAHMALVHILEVVILFVHVKNHLEGKVLATHITLVECSSTLLLAGGGARRPRHFACPRHLPAAQ